MERTASIPKNIASIQLARVTPETPITVYIRQLRDDLSYVFAKQEMCEFLSLYAEKFSDFPETIIMKMKDCIMNVSRKALFLLRLIMTGGCEKLLGD